MAEAVTPPGTAPVETPKETPAPDTIEPTGTALLKQVPEVTVHPTWQLSKEDWDARSTEIEDLKSKIASFLELGGILTPLVDALRDVADEEVPPVNQKHWLRRPLWGKK
jgi:hypothetical protein